MKDEVGHFVGNCESSTRPQSSKVQIVYDDLGATRTYEPINAYLPKPWDRNNVNPKPDIGDVVYLDW